VAKLSVTVDLLLGNIPERTSFLLPGLKAALAPYLQLAQVFLTL
jgi:26S proteasome regulatory subunit N3